MPSVNTKRERDPAGRAVLDPAATCPPGRRAAAAGSRARRSSRRRKPHSVRTRAAVELEAAIVVVVGCARRAAGRVATVCSGAPASCAAPCASSACTARERPRARAGASARRGRAGRPRRARARRAGRRRSARRGRRARAERGGVGPAERARDAARVAEDVRGRHGRGEVQRRHGGQRIASEDTVQRRPALTSRTARRTRPSSAAAPACGRPPSGPRCAAYHGGAVGIAQ